MMSETINSTVVWEIGHIFYSTDSVA